MATFLAFFAPRRETVGELWQRTLEARWARDCALERLAEAGEEEQARHRHAEHYAAFAEQAAQQLNGREHLAWLDRLEAEHDNLRAALSWSLETGAAVGERVATGLRLVQARSRRSRRSRS